MAWTDDGFQTAEKSARSVFVGNIPYDTSEEQLKDIFRAAGKVLSFRLVYDRESGKPKGYGFCEYEDQETALSAMRNLNGFEFNGRQLRVDSAAADKGKEELSAAEAVTSPYGEAVEPGKAPEAISRAVASLPPEQMFELMKQMKLCIQNNPTEARNMLLQNPQLAYALLQAQVVMRIVDPKVAMAMLHRQDNQIPPIQPSAPQSMAPPASSTNSARPRDASPAFGGAVDIPPMDRPPVPPFSNENRDGFNGAGMNSSGPFNNTGGPGNNFGGNNFVGPDPRGSNFRGPGGPQNNGPDWQRGPGPNNGNFGGPNMGGPGPNMGGPGPNMGGSNFMGGPGPNNMSGPGQNMGGPNMGGPMGNSQFMSGPNIGGPNMSGPGPNMSGPGPNMSGPGPNMGGPMPNMSGPRPMSGPGPNMLNPSPHMPSPGPSMSAPGPAMGRGGPSMSSPAQIGGARPPIAQGGPPPSNQGPPAAAQRAPAPAAAPPASAAPASSSTPDQEKAQLIMQVLQLSDAQIALLPPEQRQSILILKEQISRSGGK